MLKQEHVGNDIYKIIGTHFQGTGQDSFTQPPAQDTNQFSLLTNVMPPVDGVLTSRWGYASHGTPSSGIPQELYEFQDGNTGLRNIIATQSNTVLAYSDDMASVQPIWSTSTSASAPLRMVESRNWGYFSDGINHFKYGPTYGTSNWGLTAPSTGGTYAAVPVDSTIPDAPGTVSATTSSYQLTGTGTSFTSLNAADLIYMAGVIVIVESVQDATHLTLTAAWSLPNQTNITYKVGGIRLDMGRRYFLAFRNSRIQGYSDLSPRFTSATSTGSPAPSGDTTMTVTIPITAAPWDRSKNSSYPFGFSGDAGVAYLISGFTPVAGATVTVTWQSGLIKAAGGAAASGGGGYEAMMITTTTPSPNGPFPATYMTTTDGLAFGALCGAFCDSNGTIVEILPIGQSASFTVPATATQLYLGLNDNKFTDNSGAGWVVQIQQSTGIEGAAIPTDSTGPLQFGRVSLANLAISSDPQCDKKDILATADGGDETTLYVLATIPNAQTTYLDATKEADLLEANTALETEPDGTEIGCTGNIPPPADALLPVKHGNRLAMVTSSQFLCLSKSLAEVTTSTGNVTGRFEECWPAENEIDVSMGAEQIRGLTSNGTTLFIGTERHIHAMTGNEPSSFTDPELVFNSVGIANQDVWKTTFLEGTPTGMMWLTPDLRVVLSDFSTYQDVGYYIQDVLNTINVAAIQSSFAIISTMAPYSWYMLFVPTGSATTPNTALIFDLQTRKWVVWNFADSFVAGLHHINIAGNSQLILCKADSTFWQVSSAASGDNGGTVASTIQTAWIGGATPDVRKLLNELELIAPNANIHVTLDGTQDFKTITRIVTVAAPVESPFGQWKVYFNNVATNMKFYRLTFTCTSAANAPLLNGFVLESLFYNRL